jgi:hypothetical protein
MSAVVVALVCAQAAALDNTATCATAAAIAVF